MKNQVQLLTNFRLKGYIYNHNIISLRLGRLFGQKFHLLGSLGIESLSRFASYKGPEEFFINRNKKSTLFNYKIAGFTGFEDLDTK